MAFDGGNRLVGGKKIGEVEEAGLKYRVHPPAKTCLPGDRSGVDGPNLEILLNYLFLSLDRQPTPDFVCRVGAIEKNRRSGSGDFQDVDGLQEIELVDGHEVGLADQIGRLDWLWGDAQVRDRPRSGLLGVVDEVPLC